MPGAAINREYWGQKTIDLPPLELTAIQRESYEWFVADGIKEVLAEVCPIEDYTKKNFELTFGEHFFGEPRLTSEEAKLKGLTYDRPLKVQATLLNKQTGEITDSEVFLGDMPVMTERGTFIVNGIERCIVNQIVRSPGVFFTGEIDKATGRMLYTAEVRPLRGSWLEFSISKRDVITARIDRRRKFPATMLLRAIGIDSDDELVGRFADVDVDDEHRYLEETLARDETTNQEEAVLGIYRKMRPGDPAVFENAQSYLRSLFFDRRRYSLGRVGRYKVNKRLKLEIPNDADHRVMTEEDLVKTVRYLIGLQNGEGRVDDIDHLGNRRVRRIGELLQLVVFRVGMLRLERAVKERMSMAGGDMPVTPASLVNARPLIAIINEFFRSNQLSAILDQTNPLSEIDNLRRLSVMGEGGITRERASFSIRDINYSQYGRICPIRSPEGPNVGLVTYMSLYTRVNDYGFMETPYRKVLKEKKGNRVKMRVTDEVVYLQADDEEDYHITHAGVRIDESGYILDHRVPVRYKGDFFTTAVEEVEFIDLVPRQIVGTSASLIPFLAHDDANRALMGTHMQCQAVPLLLPEAPLVGTGMEKVVAESMGWVVRAVNPGEVVFVDSQVVVVKPGVKKPQPVVSARVIPDAIKKRFPGHDIYPVVKFVRSAQSTSYSQKPVVAAGDRVKAGDLLIDGPAADGGELALGRNLLIAYMSYEGLGYEDAIVISDRLVCEDLLTSIHIEEYTAAVVDTKLGPEETTADIPNVSEEALRNLDQDGIVVVGAHVGPNDILVGKIAPKGETELSAEERLLRAIFGEKARDVRDTSLRVPHGERGVVIGVQILDREAGDELETGTNRLIKVKVAQMRKITVGDKLAGRHGNKGIISRIVPVADMPRLADGTPIDVIISPLSVVGRMNLGQLMEAPLGMAAQRLRKKIAVPVFEKVAEERIEKEMKAADLPVSGKMTLYDGRTGQPYDQKVVVGQAYILKLIHMVEDKTHARSTGPYSLVTQQPLGGKAQMGGQRLGEMEVWALEAYGAAHTLQEMLTIKSDDVVGRAKAFEAIVKGVEIPQPTVPESFKVLVKELQSLSLDVLTDGRHADKWDAAVEKKTPDEADEADEKPSPQSQAGDNNDNNDTGTNPPPASQDADEDDKNKDDGGEETAKAKAGGGGESTGEESSGEKETKEPEPKPEPKKQDKKEEHKEDKEEAK
jgi:DNA-directed RNA polymerase subunit beta